MRFNPVSEEEASNVWAKGEYDAVVKAAFDKVSKSSGNEMIEIQLTVYGQGGQEKTVRDYLVATDGGQAKIQRFCKSAGLWDIYQSGELTDRSCLDANVRVKLGVEPGDDEYPPKNKIADYLPRLVAPPKPATELVGVSDAQKNAAPKSSPDKPPTEDDIPFAWIGWIVALTTAGSMWS